MYNLFRDIAIEEGYLDVAEDFGKIMEQSNQNEIQYYLLASLLKDSY